MGNDSNQRYKSAYKSAMYSFREKTMGSVKVSVKGLTRIVITTSLPLMPSASISDSHFNDGLLVAFLYL